MAINKSSLPINFSKGLDLKTDPFQVAPGNFLTLENTVFTKAGLMAKRNGYSQLSLLPDTNYSYLTTFQGNLTAVGNKLSAYDSANHKWVAKGNLTPIKVDTLPLVRNNVSQVQADSRTAPNGLVATIYTEFNGSAYSTKYAILDSNTSQNIVASTTIPNAAQGGRVFLIDTRFVIVYVSSTSGNLMGLVISTANPTIAPTPVNLSAIAVTSNGAQAWDGVEAGGNLYFAYNTTSGGQSIRVSYLNSALQVAAPVTFAAAKATNLSLSVDTAMPATPIIYAVWYDSASQVGRAASVTTSLGQVLAPTTIITGVAANNIISVANSGTVNFFYEVLNFYSFDATIQTDYVVHNTVTSAGVVGTPVVSIRDTGIASKAFTYNGIIYYLGVQSSPYQPTYFLVNGSVSTSANPTVIAKLAYSNGGGYDTLGLPSISINDNEVQCTYLYKDLILAVNKNTNVPSGSQTAGIYSQTGINQVTFTFTTAATDTAEIGNDLHLSGGFLSMYDGYQPVEHGFHLWPELTLNVDDTYHGFTTSINGGAMAAQQYFYQFTYEWTDNQGNAFRSAPSVPVKIDLSDYDTAVTLQAVFASGATSITVPSVTDLFVGQIIVDSTTPSSIPTGTTITAIDEATESITLSNATTAASATQGDTLVAYAPYKSVFASGATAIVVNSVANLYVGQTVSDATTSGNIATGTTITAINTSTNTITLSLATTGASASSPGDTLYFANPPVSTQATFGNRSIKLKVASTNGFQIGQIITDQTTQASIEANTRIVAIDVTNKIITIDTPTTAPSAASPGDTIQTTDTYKVSVTVPTLRITSKVASPVKIVGYRWSVAQQNYYQFTSIVQPTLNDTTIDQITIVDGLADAAILGNNLIYTTGGVVEDIGAPACNIMTLFDTRLFLVDAEDQNLLWYSKQVIESTPVEMSDLFTIYIAPTAGAQGSTGPITALSVLDDKLIIFKKNAIYYMNGSGPDNTGAQSQYSNPTFITSTVGCTNQNSIVFMPNGLMFQSDKGIWLLDRNMQTSYVGAPVETLTTGASVVSALNIPATNQVRFTLDTGTTLMYDYFFQQWGSFVGINALSSTIFQDLHTFISESGAVFQETIGTYLDGANPVLMNFTTGWISLAGLQGFERAYFFYLLGSYISPHKLNVQIAYDFAATPSQSSIIAPTNYASNWGSDTLWGGSPSWGGSDSIEQWRVFMNQQKCQSFQISITESFDGSFGTIPGAGFTLSGINLIVGVKKGYTTLRPNKSVG